MPGMFRNRSSTQCQGKDFISQPTELSRTWLEAAGVVIWGRGGSRSVTLGSCQPSERTALFPCHCNVPSLWEMGSWGHCTPSAPIVPPMSSLAPVPHSAAPIPTQACPCPVATASSSLLSPHCSRGASAPEVAPSLSLAGVG